MVQLFRKKNQSRGRWANQNHLFSRVFTNGFDFLSKFSTALNWVKESLIGQKDFCWPIRSLLSQSWVVKKKTRKNSWKKFVKTGFVAWSDEQINRKFKTNWEIFSIVVFSEVIPYARHYNPRFVYFLLILKTISLFSRRVFWKVLFFCFC